jgi:oxygen-dependent protoporphyrinogen oxidase
MRVGVVGAGITGLALTHYLADRGIDSVTLEADAEPGGVIRSDRVGGVVVERGPQRTRLTPAIADLVEVADLADAVIEAEQLPLYVYADGRLGEVPFDRRTFLGTDLLTWRGKARLLAEPLTRAGRGEESIEAVFRRKFGDEAYRNVFGPLYGGIYGSDPGKMPARHALSGLLEAEAETHSLLRAFLQRVGGGRQFPPASFDEGLQALPRGLADRYADRIRLGTPVGGIEALDDGFRLQTPEGGEDVDHVVLTAAAPAAAALIETVGSGAEALRDLTYNRLALVYLESAFDRPGLGYQVGYAEDVRTLGVTWNGQMFGRNGFYTAFLGGMHDPDVLEMDDDALGEVAAREFEQVTGAAASVRAVHRLDRGFPAWDRTWDGLDRVETPPGVWLATNYAARMGIPSRVREAASLAETLDARR